MAVYPPVPYISQQGNGVYNDCGAACALMLARWVGVGLTDSVKQWANVIDPQQDGTTFGDLSKMLSMLGLSPRNITNTYPRIELVNYQRLPLKNPDYANASFLHWVVRLDDTHYHDPLYNVNDGENLQSSRESLDAANASPVSSVGILECPTMSESARIPYDRVYNFIHSSATKAQALGVFDSAWTTKQTVGYSADDAGIGDGLNTKRAVLHFVPLKDQSAFKTFFALYYPSTIVSFANVPSVPPPVNTVSFATHLGVNVLIDARRGEDCLARGCRSVMFLNNNLAAIESARKYPTAKTFMRVWWGAKLNGTQMAAALDGSRTDVPANCYSTVLNESDTYGYNSPDEMKERFNVEKDACEQIWKVAPNRVVCIGQFSHGTPDVTRGDILSAWRETYGRFAIDNKARVRVGWHLYTKGKRFPSHPVSDSPIYDPIWFEGRDNDFWIKTNMPADVLSICDETGVEANAGGFNWAGYSNEQFIEWAYWWIDYQQLKVARHDAQIIFQCGDHPNWQGYNVEKFIDVLTGLWNGSIPRPANMPSAKMLAYDASPPYSVPPPKPMMKGN